MSRGYALNVTDWELMSRLFGRPLAPDVTVVDLIVQMQGEIQELTEIIRMLVEQLRAQGIEIT